MRTISLAVLCGLAIACASDSGGGGTADDDGETTSPTSDGPGTSSTTAGSASEAGSSGPSSTTAADAETGAPGMPCTTNDDCPDTHWCDFADDSCGVSGIQGSCEERPSDCTPDERPVCGCDAQLYESPCHAAAQAVDLAFLSQCETPNLAFDCGYSYCIGGEEACLQIGGAMPSFECVPLPPVCDPPDCSCMTDCCGCDNATCCSRFCMIDGDNITITCPG
jgi:hypothetical protein